MNVYTKQRRRGAAILLALSLLTVMALLGTTFLVVTQSYKDFSRIVEAREPVDELAVGIVQVLAMKMQDDLHGPLPGTKDKDGFPYKEILTNKPSAPSLRRRFGDYPGPQVGTKLAEDYWLATTDPGEKGSHGTNLGLGQFDLRKNLTKGMFNARTGGAVTAGNTPILDAVWQETDVYNVDGKRYYVAVRVTDLCGLINLNTAGRMPRTESDFMTPVDIDIDTVISDSLKEIETERVSSISSRKGREDFFWDVAARLHTPRLYEKPGDPKYKPFCIGDEPVARIPYSANQKLRLAKMLAKAGRFNSTYVTTYSSNRNFLRRNKDDARQRINPNINYLKNLRDADGNLVYPNEKALDALDIDRLIVREGLYPQLVEAITNPDMKPTSKAVEIAEKKAKHLVANLWAYCDGMKPEKDYLFMGVYGVVPRPVIADVYCWHNKNTAPTGQDNSFRACAIEIFNPTDAPVNLSEYELKDVPLSGTIDPQKRKVFYSYHAGNEVAPNRDEAKKTLQLSGAPIPSTWVELPDLDFSAGVTFRLMKGDVPIDAFKTSAFDKYKPIASGNYGPKSIKRDDSWDDPETYDRFEGRERYNVAMWVTSGVNKLGKPNLVGHSPMPLTVPANGKPICVEGFNIVKKRKVTKDGLDYLVCPSVGELFHLFAIGPVQGGKSLPERLATESMYNNKRVSIPIRRSDHRGKAVPAYDAHRGSLPYCVGGPWPCVLGEFVDVVPPDPTRNISHIDGKPVYAVQYGKINVNTASRTVLKALPYPHGSFYFGVKGATGGAYPTRLGRLTLDDARNIGGKIKDRVIDLPALKTPGHVMADVRDKINFMINKSNATEQCIGYVHAYASFGRIIDVLTVNSDSFAVTLKIATTKDNSTPTANGKNVMGEWSYLAVIDRSNCMNNEDVPQIMLFMPFK